MIRTTMTMLALGFLAVSDVSAMAATKASHHMKPVAVAANEGAAPAGDEAKPATTKETKKAHKAKAGAKGAAKQDKGTDAAGAPAPEAAPQK
jgi:hypothetical protein